MSREDLKGLPALEKIATLAQQAGVEVRPSFGISATGGPVVHKKKIWVDGRLCSVFTHRAYRYAEPKNPQTRKLVQIASAPVGDNRPKPEILIFCIKISDGVFEFDDAFCIPASYYYRRCPKGSTHIPIEPAKRPERGARIEWEKFRGTRGLRLALYWSEATT